MQASSFGRKYIPIQPENGQKKVEKEEPIRLSTWLRLFFPVALVIVGVVIAVVFALISGEGISWLFVSKSVSSGELGDITGVLAPILALALAIERIVETVFDLIEQATDEVAKLGSGGLDGLKWFQQELDRAWDAAEEAFHQLEASGAARDEKLLAQLKIAERRIVDANNRIAGLAKDPKYVSIKRVASICISLILGLVVAIVSDSGLCELLQISVPRILDMLVTGFVIGAGSGPMHSLVGILQGAKDTLGSLGNLGSLEHLKEQIEELQVKGG